MLTDGFVEVSLQGDKELITALKGLTRNLERAAIRKALRAAAKPILATAKTNAPKETGALKRSLRIKAFKKSRKNIIGYTIGTTSSHKAYGGKQFYGAFQEFGWKIGKRSEDVKLAQSRLRYRPLSATATRKQIKRRERIIAHARAAIAADKRTKEKEGIHYIERAYHTHKRATAQNLKRLIFQGIEEAVAAENRRLAKKAAKAATQ